ncbi:MAG: GrdX family protein [Andreesenia angusta]|nr:GrdX family protein [Andreesenia angusta]
MGIKIITNNSKVRDMFSENYNLEYLDTDYIGVLKKIRDMVHLGFKLYTHPLSGSIKPNETPYKSVIVSDTCKGLDFESLEIIESSIRVAEKFLKDRATPNWLDKAKEDFKEIDYSIIDDALKIRG